MGVTIRCQRTKRNIDMGYFSLHRLRMLIARKMSQEFAEHYERGLAMSLQSEECEEYDRKTEDWLKKPGISLAVADFLYQPDCDGRCSHQACWRIYQLIKDEPDDKVIGYPGWKNPARMSDFKQILLDCNKHKCCMEWN